MPGRRLRAPTLDELFVAAFALLGVRLGATPIGDNSAFWHIRTGIDAVAGQGIPRTDPYSWTAAGEPWVVQSWLAELAYGAAHRVGGFGGVVVLNAVVLGFVAGLMAVLASTGRPRRTLLAAGLAMLVSAGWWSPRPLLFGLLGLGVAIWLRQRRAHLGWFALLGALWVNVHGSFVLGPLWLLLAAGGGLLDRRHGDGDRRRDLRGDVVGAGVLVAGAVFGALASPPGWRLLTFPATAATRRDVFSTVIEWQAPDFFAGPVELLALGGLIAAGAVLVATRPPLRLVLPAVAYAVAGVLSQRNMATAGVALAPALGAGLRAWPARASGRTLVGSPRLNWLLAGVMAAAAVLFVVQGARQPGLDLSDYPVAAVEWMEEEGHRREGARIAHTDVAGGWLILRDGRRAGVFVDDRVDMYPPSLLADYRSLLAGGAEARTVLDERRIDVVLWPKAEEKLLSVLAASPGWERAFSAEGWEVWRRG